MPEPGSRRLAIGTWLFSPRDLVVKLAAIAGMVLCLHGGVVTMQTFCVIEPWTVPIQTFLQVSRVGTTKPLSRMP